MRARGFGKAMVDEKIRAEDADDNRQGAETGNPHLPDAPTRLRASLLDWYDRHRRTLPWRAVPGETPDPYRVWLSEVMLQQTTVQSVGRYFQDFTSRWPTVADLAAAADDEILSAWAGLGYYARARNLIKCARAVTNDRGGVFPTTEDGLAALPGIGDYTSAAIAAIAFDRPSAVMDGNVERVIARLSAVETPLPAAKPTLKALVRAVAPTKAEDRPGDFAQATMDLGATICTPRKPKCILCPWQAPCLGRRAGIEETLPRKQRKAKKPTRRGMAFVLIDPMGSVLLRRRPETGLLGGMMEVPSTDWLDGETPSPEEARSDCPIPTRLQLLPGIVRHTFTHFHLELQVAVGSVTVTPPPEACRWVGLSGLADQALPTVMLKVLRHAGKAPAQR